VKRVCGPFSVSAGQPLPAVLHHSWPSSQQQLQVRVHRDQQDVFEGRTSGLPASQKRTTSKRWHRFECAIGCRSFAKLQDKDRRFEAYKLVTQRRTLSTNLKRREPAQSDPCFGSNCWAMAAAFLPSCSLPIASCLAGSRSGAPARLRAASLLGPPASFACSPALQQAR